MTEHCIAMTTVGDARQAADLARELVDARLAACVQLLPIHSIYRWQGAVTEDDEHLLLIKTRSGRYTEVEAFVAERHTYDVPEVVRLSIEDGLAGYLAWIDDATG